MTDDTQDQEPTLNPVTAEFLAAEGMSPERIRTMNPGCVLPFMIFLWVMGFSLYATVGPNSAINTTQGASSSQSNAQDSALPVIQPSGTPTPASATPAPSDTTTTQGNSQQPSGQTPSDQGQNPGQQASPPPANNTPPPPTCTIGYPSEIDVQGGDPGVLGGGGGSFTATTTNPVLVASVDNCGDGHHFEISWSSSGTNADGTTGSANGTDCEMSQFNTVVSNTNPGYTVSVTMILPVNSCG